MDTRALLYLISTSSDMSTMPDYIGVMVSPNQQFKPVIGIEQGRKWAMDNNAFTTGFDVNRLKEAMSTHRKYRETCLFVVLPDVVGNAQKTRELYDLYAEKLEPYHFPLAYVLQDGQEEMPPVSVACWFLGGTDKWKLSNAARQFLDHGKNIGKWIHVGRVNSHKRVMRFDGLADSVDGNCWKFGPDIHRKKIAWWMEEANGIRPKQQSMAAMKRTK